MMFKIIRATIKSVLLLCIIGQIFLLTSCGTQTDVLIDEEKVHIEKTDERENENMIITAEYLQKEFGISEEELEGINLEEFLAYYDFTIDNIQEKNISYWLQQYKEELNGDFFADYSYLLKGKSNLKLTVENEEEIVRFLWHHAFGETNEFIVIDFESGRIFEGQGVAVSFLTEENVTGVADDILKNKLRDCFQQYNIYSWWDLDIQASDMVEESWNIVIELTDGRACKLWGEKLTGEDVPENLVPFIKEVEALVGSSNP